ncbi:tyrosine-type recombinase/integrase [Rhodococcus sp. 05-2254-5]|uniref:tyrosine-type recombinase/integrase n=1 Tax=Rhodococcus sp. 05-2254-5 TaxID=2022511 RepID=UPI00359C9AF8
MLRLTGGCFLARTGIPCIKNSVDYRWLKAKKKVVQPDWHLHDLRDFFASGLIYTERDVVTVQKALGHSSPNVTLFTSPTSGRMQMAGRVRPRSRCSTRPFSRLRQVERNCLTTDREIYCGRTADHEAKHHS